MVCAATDYYAGTLLSDLKYYFFLNCPEIIPRGETAHHSGGTLKGEGVGKNTSAFSVLAFLHDKFRRKTGFKRYFIYDFPIIEGNTESVCHFFGDAVSAAAELSAYS